MVRGERRMRLVIGAVGRGREVEGAWKMNRDERMVVMWKGTCDR